MLRLVVKDGLLVGTRNESRGFGIMESRMATEQMQTNGEEQSNDDKFVIVAIDPRSNLRKLAFSRIKELFGEVEIIAPEEERMIRPRRKNRSKGSQAPVVIKRPIFYQYVALRWPHDNIFKLWHLRTLFGVWNTTLMRGKPAFVSREKLLGMLQEHRFRSWDGMLVEVVSGPLQGKMGRYTAGKVEVELLGRKAFAKVNSFNLKLVK